MVSTATFPGLPTKLVLSDDDVNTAKGFMNIAQRCFDISENNLREVQEKSPEFQGIVDNMASRYERGEPAFDPSFPVIVRVHPQDKHLFEADMNDPNVRLVIVAGNQRTGAMVHNYQESGGEDAFSRIYVNVRDFKDELELRRCQAMDNVSRVKQGAPELVNFMIGYLDLLRATDPNVDLEDVAKDFGMSRSSLENYLKMGCLQNIKVKDEEGDQVTLLSMVGKNKPISTTNGMHLAKVKGLRYLDEDQLNIVVQHAIEDRTQDFLDWTRNFNKGGTNKRGALAKGTRGYKFSAAPRITRAYEMHDELATIVSDTAGEVDKNSKSYIQGQLDMLNLLYSYEPVEVAKKEDEEPERVGIGL